MPIFNTFSPDKEMKLGMASFPLGDPCSSSALYIFTSAFAEFFGVWAVTGVVTLKVMKLIFSFCCIGSDSYLISLLMIFFFCILPFMSFSFETLGFFADLEISYFFR
jgi:NAD kinase